MHNEIEEIIEEIERLKKSVNSNVESLCPRLDDLAYRYPSLVIKIIHHLESMINSIIISLLEDLNYREKKDKKKDKKKED